MKLVGTESEIKEMKDIADNIFIENYYSKVQIVNCSLDDYEKQFILYAKNWFKEIDTITDLKIIWSKYSYCEPKDLRDYDIYSLLCQTLAKIMKEWHINNIERFFKEIFKIHYEYKNELKVQDLIEKILEEFMMLPVTLTGDLGEPDYSILPKKEVD